MCDKAGQRSYTSCFPTITTSVQITGVRFYHIVQRKRAQVGDFLPSLLPFEQNPLHFFFSRLRMYALGPNQREANTSPAHYTQIPAFKNASALAKVQ